VKLRTQVLAIRRGVDEFVVHFDCFDTRQPHSPVAWDSVEPFEQVPKSKWRQSRLATSRLDAVMPNMDSAEYDLTVSVVDQSSNFRFNRLRCPALQARSDLRNNAICAVQNAAILNFHVGSPSAIKMADAVWHVDDAQPIEHVGQFTLIADNLKDAGQIPQHFWIASRVTPHHDCTCAGIFLRQLSNQLPALGICLTRYRAGIDDAQIRCLIVRRLPKSVAEERFFHELRFVLIDFAPEGRKPARAFGHGISEENEDSEWNLRLHFQLQRGRDQWRWSIRASIPLGIPSSE